MYTIALYAMSSSLKRPKKGRTTPPFETLPLECLLYVFRFRYPAHLLFRWKLYTLEKTEHTDSKNEVTQSVCYDSLLSMNEFSVHFDFHRQQYQHLRVHRTMHQQDVACTGESIYAYCPIIFAYSTLAVSHLPKQPAYYLCCPRDQQTIILTSYKPYISDSIYLSYLRKDDFVLTDSYELGDDIQIYRNLPDPLFTGSRYRILIHSDYTKNWYGIHCIGDIVEGVVMSYLRRPSEQQPIKLDTWTIEDFV